jgi:hypothetical protein
MMGQVSDSPGAPRGLLNQRVVDVVAAYPKPYELVGRLEGQRAILQRNPRRPDLRSFAITNFFELQRSVTWVAFQQSELFIGPRAYVLR